jgi:two-component system, cell cycle sensor histidine kinase and response regulator CckA
LLTETPVLSGSYDHNLVALSILIAICASYAALDLAGRVTAARGRVRVFWLIGGATSLGLGIWSMHSIGMLAFSLPVPVSYDWPTVLLSLLAAILAAAVALYVVSRKVMSLWRAVAGSIVMGSGIAGMHYIGMEAMRLVARCSYDTRLVGISVALAIVISYVALRLAYLAREEKQGASLRKVVSAAVMGLAIPVMHYTGMAAASFKVDGFVPDMSHAIGITALGAAGITIVTMVILSLAILTSVYDRRFSAQSLELESAEQRYRQLFERTLAGVIRTTMDGQILECNLACARIFGYATCEELTANPAADLYFHPEDRKTFIAILRKVKSLTNYEQCLRRKDGSKVWLLGSSNLVEGKGGAPAVNEETFVDITERRNAEDTFRKAFNANPEPITIATLPEGRYLDVNDSFLRVTGYSREEVIGRTSKELNFWARPEDRATFIEMVVKQGSVRDFEIAFRTKSGEIRVAMDSAEIIDVAGQKCTIAIFRDVTERKTLEKQLRQTQKMEAVGQLTGGIAHDFNNLLGVIIGYSEILEHRLPAGDPLHKECQQIKKAGQSAASLTRQLLAFSRQQVLEPKVLDINAIVLNVEKMLQRLIGEHIDLRTNLDHTLGSVKADQNQMEQVIINLAVNARDAMPQGGKLLIETANVDLDEDYARRHPPQLPGSYVLLSVADTGMGMDAETQSHIFEPFFTTKEVGKGTGLGLATVYGVVRQSGGHIWVYSELGQGTTFKIYLPRAGQTPGLQHPLPSPAEYLRGSETVLLVEDEEALRELTRSLLEGAGYTVLEAELPEAAIEIALRHGGPIHLLLTDMVMPGMTGRDLGTKLAPIRPEMKVVYMSGYTGFTHAGLADSEIALLGKPFTREKLLRKLREALESEIRVEAK